MPRRSTQALAKGTALKTQFPATSLGQQLQQVAQIIQVASYLGMSRQIFFCSLGGFDTHAGELEAHNTLYPQLSQADRGVLRGDRRNWAWRRM